MRRLIDTYIRSEDSRKIGEFDDFTLLDFVETQRLMMRNVKPKTMS